MTNEQRWGKWSIAYDLAHQIRDGRLQPGDQLLSVRELADDYGVKIGTMRTVMDMLRFAGWVHSRQGKAYFVASRPRRGWPPVPQPPDGGG